MDFHRPLNGIYYYFLVNSILIPHALSLLWALWEGLIASTILFTLSLIKPQ